MTEQSISEQSSYEPPESEEKEQLEIEPPPSIELRLELDLQVLDCLSQTEKWLDQPVRSEAIREYFNDLLFILAQVQAYSELSGDQILLIASNLESIWRSYQSLELEQSRQNQFVSNFSLWQEYQTLKLERDELCIDRSQLLSEIAQLKRDKTSTYVVSASGTPHHHELVQRFVHFREQDLKAIANEIFRLKSQDLPSPTRKQEIAKIRSVLSSKIFVQSDTIEGAIAKICQDLQLDSSFNTPDSQLYQTVKAGFHLRWQMSIADPPAQLSIESAGTRFNPEHHESVPGCDDTEICFTVHPAYLVGDRVLTKALVFTSSQLTNNEVTS